MKKAGHCLGYWILCCFVLAMLGAGQCYAADSDTFKSANTNLFRPDDVAAWVGGGDVAAALHTGHLEAVLSIIHPDIQIRNFGWEGDTVYQQPRDFGFPPLETHLEKAGATVILFQFGRTEALEGTDAINKFTTAYERLLDRCKRKNVRFILVTPPPFESGPSRLPNLSSRNSDLARYRQAILDLAHTRKLPVIDLFTALSKEPAHGSRLTDNGLQLTPRGHAIVSAAFAKELVQGKLATLASSCAPDGRWTHMDLEEVRQATIRKNELWYHYWRPQNWAFLGGDRTTQPSSRDHKDPSVRWFPAEMEKYVPLIEAEESKLRERAQQAAKELQ